MKTRFCDLGTNSWDVADTAQGGAAKVIPELLLAIEPECHHKELASMARGQRGQFS